MVVKKFKYLNRWYLWYLNVLLLYKICSSSKMLYEILLIILCSVQCRFSAAGRWVAKLVAHLLSAAALRVWIQTYLKRIQNERHKERSGQHTLVRQKIYKKKDFLQCHSGCLSLDIKKTPLRYNYTLILCAAFCKCFHYKTLSFMTSNEGLWEGF